jgi:hypothetical protein
MDTVETNGKSRAAIVQRSRGTQSAGARTRE